MAERYNIDRSADRLTKLTQAQDGTINEIVDMIKSHQIALMIRPTGFGKSRIMMKLAKNTAAEYRHVLYIYPLNVIKKSIESEYHKTLGNEPIPPYSITTDGRKIENPDGIWYAKDKSEQDKWPELPLVEFCSYSKMLHDYNEAYKNPLVNKSGKVWTKLSQQEQDKIKEKWDKLTPEEQKRRKDALLKKRLSNIQLVILDEAHMTGAEGFMSYWEVIHDLAFKGNKEDRLHIVGATATPLRTQSDIDIEKEIFYYDWGEEKKSARIGDFGWDLCWAYEILKRPYYIRGVLDTDKEIAESLDRINKEKAYKLKAKDLENIQDELKLRASNLKNVYSVIETGISHVAQDKLDNHSYIRLLVFHPDTESMIEDHQKINVEINRALIENCGYKNVNTYYIVSNKDAEKDPAIQVSSVDILTQRDEELKNKPDTGNYTVDVVHSINMLNMGYHVGDVTGIIIRRKTGSEIIYYQQIGRCVSVKKNNQPLIIDLANAAGELLDRAVDDQRADAVYKINRFIAGCEHDEYQNREVDNFYKYINTCLNNEPLDDSILNFWYFNRSAPIYYIYGICKALEKKDTLESIVYRIHMECTKNRGISITLDTAFCQNIPRIHASTFKNYIAKQPQLLQKAIAQSKKRRI